MQLIKFIHISAITQEIFAIIVLSSFGEWLEAQIWTLTQLCELKVIILLKCLYHSARRKTVEQYPIDRIDL